MSRCQKITQSSKNWASMKSVENEDPALEVHDHVRDGKVDHQLVTRGPDILVSESKNRGYSIKYKKGSVEG